MPQLSIFDNDDRRAINWTYSIDPINPDRDPMFTAMVTGSRNLTCEYGVAFPPFNVVHQEVRALLLETWAAYLFGEPGDVRRAVAHAHNDWKRESRLRSEL